LNALVHKHRFITILLNCLGVIHQSPSLGRYRCRSRVTYVDMLAGPARYGTLMNFIKESITNENIH